MMHITCPLSTKYINLTLIFVPFTFFCLTCVLFASPILTMMHLLIMLYMHWTPMLPFICGKFPAGQSRPRLKDLVCCQQLGNPDPVTRATDHHSINQVWGPTLNADPALDREVWMLHHIPTTDQCPPLTVWQLCAIAAVDHILPPHPWCKATKELWTGHHHLSTLDGIG